MTKKSNTDLADDLAKLFSDQLSEQDAERIGRTLDTGDRYPEEDMAVMVEALQDLPDLATDKDIQKYLKERPRSQKPWQKFSTAVAAIMVIAVVAWQFLWPEPLPEKSHILRYVTGIGEQKTVNLKDGSKLTLNTATQVLVDFNHNRRRIIMDRGEAFFAVAKDPARPFTVELDGRAVTALGTQFNIRKQPDKFTLALVEGQVAIHKSSDSVSGDIQSLADQADGNLLELNIPGQQRVEAGWVVDCHLNSHQLTAQKVADISRLSGWTSGFLEFYEKPLVYVVNELNRYSGKKILITDSSIMDLEVYAGIRIDQLDQALKGLEKTLPIEIVSDFDTILITGSSE
ncbi:FecR family protein [Porticoccus sp. GXU_MW_L64]